MDKERKRAQWGWYLYDFGNSAYAAVAVVVAAAVRDAVGRITTGEGEAGGGTEGLTVGRGVGAAAGEGEGVDGPAHAAPASRLTASRARTQREAT